MTTTTPEDTASAAHDGASLRERKKQQTWQSIHQAAVALVTEHGVAGVTVEAICAAADVSPRTFFNYFPSKSAAALGLPATVLPDTCLAQFRSADGNVVDDVCDLLAYSFPLPNDRAAVKAMVHDRPELAPAMMQWMGELRSGLVALVAERAGEERARLAVALVFAAFGEIMHSGEDTRSRDDIAAALRSTVAAIRAV
ncbi:TetR/AcrR family transcriptional regulator [Curtobacterium ammoniigenes]|uniref:TetR/AcrR family transcriptional regulator n=1 Tax=Curtobacterium ammoniigenes TaxID=395387 RepID=UPI0009FB3642|nr:TetR/AcrR family transcriptional regulator [Curtobacterium ammoniigenes]